MAASYTASRQPMCHVLNIERQKGRCLFVWATAELWQPLLTLQDAPAADVEVEWPGGDAAEGGSSGDTGAAAAEAARKAAEQQAKVSRCSTCALSLLQCSPSLQPALRTHCTQQSVLPCEFVFCR